MTVSRICLKLWKRSIVTAKRGLPSNRQKSLFEGIFFAGDKKHVGFKKRSKIEVTHRIKDDKIGVSFHVNNNSLKISIGSKKALPKLHRDYDKNTICMKYLEEDGFYWHIYLPKSSFKPIDWI